MHFLAEGVAILTNFGFRVPGLAASTAHPALGPPTAFFSAAVNLDSYVPVTLGLPRKSFESSCSTSFFRGLKSSPRGTSMGSKNRWSWGGESR